MNADGLLAHYGKIADAPDAVPRLRRFILDLAVRSKLVEQAPNDEPASGLLKRIAAEKARLAKAGEIKKSKSKQADRFNTLFDLPKSWKWAALCDLFLYDAGVKRHPKNLNQKLWLLELEDIEKDSGRLLVRITASERKSKSTKSEFRVGDILYGKLRPYLNKVLVADRPGYSTTEIVAFRPFLRLCPQYCALALRRPDFVDYVTRLGQGTKMPRLRTEDAAIAPFPLPPLAEQHRIVAKVDELMALCDRLETARTVRETTRGRLAAASLARLNEPDPDPAVFQNHAAFAFDNLIPLTTRPDQIKALRQTILNLAVRGKLVKQDPNDEPASELLARFRKAKAEQKRETRDARIKTAPDANDECLPFELPKSWCAQSFENLFLFIDYRGKTPPKTDNGVALITAKNVRMGHLDHEPREYVSDATFCTWMTRGFPRIGDLFFTTEAPLGNVCLNNIDEPFALAQRVICMQPYADIDTRFLMYGLMSDSMQSLIHEHATGLTAKGIKASKLKPLPIPIPPLAEQHRIVANVDELMTLCDRLEASLAAGDHTRRRLLDALLYEALEETLEPVKGHPQCVM